MMGFVGVLVLVLLAAGIVLHYPSVKELKEEKPAQLAKQLDRLWNLSHDSIKNKHYLKAEKILLTLLRVDNKNAAAYNRLGLLYAKEREFRDAIECFEIAQSLDPSPGSLHNVGLLYFEMGDYELAAQALEQALGQEEDVAVRHISYAKVQEKLGNHAQVIKHLERAVVLAPSKQLLNLLAQTYREYELNDKAKALEKKLKSAQVKSLPSHEVQKNRATI